MFSLIQFIAHHITARTTGPFCFGCLRMYKRMLIITEKYNVRPCRRLALIFFFFTTPVTQIWLMAKVGAVRQSTFLERKELNFLFAFCAVGETTWWKKLNTLVDIWSLVNSDLSVGWFATAGPSYMIGKSETDEKNSWNCRTILFSKTATVILVPFRLVSPTSLDCIVCIVAVFPSRA